MDELLVDAHWYRPQGCMESVRLGEARKPRASGDPVDDATTRQVCKLSREPMRHDDATGSK